jgi:hypothetical protein
MAVITAHIPAITTPAIPPGGNMLAPDDSGDLQVMFCPPWVVFCPTWLLISLLSPLIVMTDRAEEVDVEVELVVLVVSVVDFAGLVLLVLVVQVSVVCEPAAVIWDSLYAAGVDESLQFCSKVAAVNARIPGWSHWHQ